MNKKEMGAVALMNEFSQSGSFLFATLKVRLKLADIHFLRHFTPAVST